MSVASADGRAADADIAVLLGKLQVRVGEDLLDRALMHRSFAYENGGLPTNERLEFLGDSVLGLIVTDTLFRQHPDLPEGNLAKLRAAVVNSRALAGVARGLRLGCYVRLGKGEESTGGRDKSSILGDTLEAVIGAVYLEGGMEAAGPLVHRLFDPVIARSARLGAGLDWKTSLQGPRISAVPSTWSTRAGPTTRRRSAPWPRSAARSGARGKGGPRRKPSSRPPRRPGRPSVPGAARRSRATTPASRSTRTALR